MRYDWRHILSWTELLCFVLVWSIGIGAALLQVYAADRGDTAGAVAATDNAPASPVLVD